MYSAIHTKYVVKARHTTFIVLHPATTSLLQFACMGGFALSMGQFSCTVCSSVQPALFHHSQRFDSHVFHDTILVGPVQDLHGMTSRTHHPFDIGHGTDSGFVLVYFNQCTLLCDFDICFRYL